MIIDQIRHLNAMIVTCALVVLRMIMTWFIDSYKTIAASHDAIEGS